MSEDPETSVVERSSTIFGKETISFPLPFYKQIAMPLPGDPPPINPGWLSESCGFKVVTGALMGSVLGVGLGLFMGAMSDVSPIQVVRGREVPQAPLREQMRAAYKATGTKSIGWAKQFGVLTAIFSGTECVLEKYRAKTDVWNSVVSGCAVGAAMSAKAGPTV